MCRVSCSGSRGFPGFKARVDSGCMVYDPR
jgi:hypothetical protein